LTDLPPIAPEDLEKFGVESRLIPSFVSIFSQVEQSSDALPSLSQAEKENLVEILDQVKLPP
jgi:hypothetical protein